MIEDPNERVHDAITFIFPPGGRDLQKLIHWGEMNGFEVEDWCEWRRADGGYMSIGPAPPPPPLDT